MPVNILWNGQSPREYSHTRPLRSPALNSQYRPIPLAGLRRDSQVVLPDPQDACVLSIWHSPGCTSSPQCTFLAKNIWVLTRLLFFHAPWDQLCHGHSSEHTLWIWQDSLTGIPPEETAHHLLSFSDTAGCFSYRDELFPSPDPWDPDSDWAL